LAAFGTSSREATQAGVEIVTFPEMCLTGYWHVRKLDRDAFEALAEPVPAGPCTRELMRLSSENRMTIGAGLLERADDGRIYNSYVVAMPDGSWQVHRKLHVFEHPNISAGDHYTVFDTPHGCRVGVLICYDNNIVENARATALLGAEILLAPQQTGGMQFCEPAWNEAGGSRDLGAPRGGSGRCRSGVVWTEGSRMAHALVAEPRARQRYVLVVQQWHRPR
jgi:predicted amidohydrolase